MTILKCPEIRFKNDDGNNYPNWEDKKLDNVFKFYKGKGISKIELSEEGIPCIIYGELYTKYREVIGVVKSKTNIKKELLFMSEIGDILIPSSGETQKDIATASTVMEKNVALGGDINILRSKETINSPYVSYYLKHIKNIEISKLSQGNSVVHLYSKQLSNLKIEIPSLEEQQKIGDFFMLLDKRIEQQEQKIALLKDYKKAMMQKIFSQKIRFKDENGNNYPDWEEKKLGEVCNITTGKLDANAMSPGGKYRFYTCAKEFYNIDYFAFDTEALLISGNGANVGYIHYYNGKFNAYQRTYVLDNFSQNTLFIKYFLDEFLYKRINSEKKDGNTPYIVIGVLLEMKLLFPILSEQEKISILLFKIDNNIEKQEIILEKLKSKKKSLLYNMFM